MKMGILAAAALVLVALYLVFGSEMLTPASSDSIANAQEHAGTDTRRDLGQGAGSQATSDKPDSPDPGDLPDDTRPGLGGEGEVGSTLAPVQPGSNEGVERTPGAPPAYTRHDGVVVRDHRPNPSEPDLDAYVVLPPEASKVKPNTLVEVRRALREPMKACIDSHGEGAAEGAKLQLLLLTSIASERLSVDKVSLKIAGLASETDLRGCVEAAVLGYTQAVPGAEDVNIHRMVFRYDL